MSDLISRQDAINAIKNAICWDGFRDEYGLISKKHAYTVLSHIDPVKQEVKAGHWIHCPETERFLEHWSCSICGHDIIENPRYKNFITGERLDFVFCPFCGSQMQVGCR